MIVTGRVGDPDLNPQKCIRPSVIVMAYPWAPMHGGKPIKLMASAIRQSVVIDSRIKCLNYLNFTLAKIQALAFKADDAFMLDTEGFVAEATGANVFIIKNNVLYSPLLTN